MSQMSQRTPSNTIPFLEAEELSCATADRVLFSDLSFALDRGSLASLRGANGSGKSCLLQSLCGVARQGVKTKGRVRWQGRAVPFEGLASETMLVGHNPPFLNSLSLLENLRFWARVFAPRDHEQTLPTCARWFALEDFWQAPLSRLSAGEQQRGALAMVALKPHARLWAVSEPEVSLDAQARQQLHSCLQDHLKRGGAAMIALHESLPESLQQKVGCNLMLSEAVSTP